MPDLNITNGDVAADLLRASGAPGDVLAWRDPMHHGPMPADQDLAGLSNIRATYLAGPDHDQEAAKEAFRIRDARLLAATGDTRVTLWFEHDLLDQLQILQILDALARSDPVPEDLGIVCINAFPGIVPFRGLGQLTADQIASLWPRRKPVTPAMLALAKTGWAAYRAGDPHVLQRFTEGDLSALPLLRPALQRHMEEFPDNQTGLTRTERQLLQLVADGHADPVTLFTENMALEQVLYVGDIRTFHHLRALCAGGLLDVHGGSFLDLETARARRQRFRDQRFDLTEAGRGILGGAADAFSLMERDDWLGGVKLRDGAGLWTWNAKSRTFMRRAI